jgi:hypothetical protein
VPLAADTPEQQQQQQQAAAAAAGAARDTAGGRDAGAAGAQGPKLQRPYGDSLNGRQAGGSKYYDSQPHQDLLGPPPDCRCCVVQ